MKNLTGNRFGKLVVLYPAGKNGTGRCVWECQCDCGNVTIVPANNLTSGNTQSCGCLRKEKERHTEQSAKMAWEKKPVCVEEFNKVIRKAKGMSYGKYVAQLCVVKENIEIENE